MLMTAGGVLLGIQKVLYGDQATKGCRVIARSQFDGGAGRGGAGIFGIQDRFPVVAVHSRVGAVIGPLGGAGWTCVNEPSV